MPDPLIRTLLTLTFTTGLIDAASYLGLGHVFTANMTGNVVLLGFGLAGGTGLPVVAPLLSLGAFLAGAAVGGRVAARSGEAVHTSVRAALAVECAFVAVGAVIAAATSVRPLAFAADTIVVLLAFPLGVRNALVRHLKVPDLTTTVLTMTLTGLAADRPSPRRVAAVVTMLAGALVGALEVETALWLPLATAAALAFVSALGYRPAAPGGAAGTDQSG